MIPLLLPREFVLHKSMKNIKENINNKPRPSDQIYNAAEWCMGTKDVMLFLVHILGCNLTLKDHTGCSGSAMVMWAKFMVHWSVANLQFILILYRQSTETKRCISFNPFTILTDLVDTLRRHKKRVLKSGFQLGIVSKSHKKITLFHTFKDPVLLPQIQLEIVPTPR